MGSANKKEADKEAEAANGTIETSVVYQVYPERWLVLAVCCFLALSNAMVNLNLNFE